MNDGNTLLITYCSNKTLDALACGIANRLGLSYRSIAGPKEVAGLLGSNHMVILVIGRERLDNSCIEMVRKASDFAGVVVICVADTLAHESTCAAFQSGAISCITTEDALRSLLYVIETVCDWWKASLRKEEAPKEIQIGESFRLILPGYKITDEQMESTLSPTPGKLLECLAANIGKVVTFSTLISKAWESPEDNRRKTLHQQMYILRKALEVYGRRDWIKCQRGIGYLLDTMDESR